jgi:DNA (cytosine-5)-methyltransferase 1
MFYAQDAMKIETSDPRQIQAIDLFCGAGGLTYGLRNAGIKVLAGVDVDPACKYPYEENNAAPFCLRDVSQLKGDTLKKLYTEGSVKMLAGCAPCQPFSTYSNGRKAHLSSKWGLLSEFGRLVGELKPELVTMENVPRIEGYAPFNDFVVTLKRLKYNVVWEVLNCAEFGVPQHRKRMVLLASRLGEITMPRPTRKDPKKWMTVRKAIGGLNEIAAGTRRNAADPLHIASQLSETNLDRIKQSVPGGSWEDWPEDLRADCHQKDSGRSYKSVYGRMSWDQPSPTMTTLCFGFGNGRFGHPEQNRAISLREAAILQSFPRKYAFCPKDETVEFRTIGRMIGNAVPPGLGHAIGKAFAVHVSQVGNISRSVA